MSRYLGLTVKKSRKKKFAVHWLNTQSIFLNSGLFPKTKLICYTSWSSFLRHQILLHPTATISCLCSSYRHDLWWKKVSINFAFPYNQASFRFLIFPRFSTLKIAFCVFESFFSLEVDFYFTSFPCTKKDFQNNNEKWKRKKNFLTRSK